MASPRYVSNSVNDDSGSRQLRVSDVVKALRCELTTFLVENRLRQKVVQNAVDDLNKNYTAPSKKKSGEEIDRKIIEVKALADKYNYLEVDPRQYANLSVDLKNVNALTLGFGYDWKRPSLDPKTLISSVDLIDYHAGLSYNQTDTFEFIQNYAVSQLIDLGPTSNYLIKLTNGEYVTPLPPDKVEKLTSTYNTPPSSDQTFYCYKHLILDVPSASSIESVADQVNNLVEDDDDAKKYEQYTRVHIGDSSVTLAQWLQNVAADAAINTHTVVPSNGNLIMGQNEYTFTIDVKPGLAAQYNLVAEYAAPAPSASYTPERLSTFTFYLNAVQSVAAINAKTGNSCNQTAIDFLNSHGDAKPPLLNCPPPK